MSCLQRFYSCIHKIINQRNFISFPSNNMEQSDFFILFIELTSKVQVHLIGYEVHFIVYLTNEHISRPYFLSACFKKRNSYQIDK